MSVRAEDFFLLSEREMKAYLSLAEEREGPSSQVPSPISGEEDILFRLLSL